MLLILTIITAITMGIILAKLRTKKTTFEVLEKLDTEIKSIEEFKRSTEQTHKKIVGRFVLISIFVYLFTALMIYFYFFPSTFYERMLYIVPLILAPVVILTVKRILTWYYDRKLNKKTKKLVSLKDEKRKLLEEVMDKETYKVATSILEKFAPEQVRKNPFLIESTPIKPSTSTLSKTATGLRYRGQLSQAPNRYSFGAAPVTPLPETKAILPPPTGTVIAKNTPQLLSQSIVPAFQGNPGTPLLLPRAILPRDRTVFDKMVDYLVGDGPSNRYALICKQCSSHNGMALKEEFDYLSFRCCYCLTLNPARKKRPAAPKLEEQSQRKQAFLTSSDSEEKNSLSSESDSERESPKDDDTKLSDTEDVDKLSDFELMKGSDSESSHLQQQTAELVLSGNTKVVEENNQI